MNFTNVIGEIIVLILLILLGFFCAKFRLFHEQHSQMLSMIVIKITFPLLIIVSMNRKFSDELLYNSVALIAISVLVYSVILLMIEVWGRKTKKPHEQSAVLKWVVIFGNCAFMGFPVINAVYGSIGVFYAAVFNIFYTFLLFSYGVAILHKGAVKTAWKGLLNPGLIASVIGFTLFACRITLPYVILRPMQMVGDMTIPLALIVSGISLAQIPVKELVRPVDIWITSFIRLLAFPAVLLLILPLFQLNQYLIAVPVIIMGTPAALTAGAFAMSCGCDHELASKSVVLSNFLSVVTMPVVVWAAAFALSV